MPADRITWRRQMMGLLFASPYIAGIFVFLLYPLGMALYYSFCQFPVLRGPMWIGLDNYKQLLGVHRDAATGALVASDPVFWQVLYNTLIFAIFSVPLSLVTSILLALLLNVKIKGQGFYRTVVFLPSLVPAAAGAMLWLWVFNGDQGLLNVLLMDALQLINAIITPVGLPAINWLPPNWLGIESLVKPVFIFLSVYSVGNAVVIFLAGLQDIPLELYEAASIDGAGGWTKMRNVTLPLLSPVIFFNLIMGIIGAWQVFTLPYIMVGTGANRSGYFYSQYLFDSAFMDLRMGYASAMAWIQFAIIMALTGLTIWSAKKWVHYG